MRSVLLLAVGTAMVLQAQEVQRPRILGIPHIAFRVHDITASRHFYKDFLGFSEPFSIQPDGKLSMTFIKINDHQYIELAPETKPGEASFIHLAVQTDNAEQFRLYLKSKGVKASDKPAAKGRIRNTSTSATDPDGNVIDVTQYEPDGESMKFAGKEMPDTRISRRMLHVGFYVSKPETLAYYRDILGFREFWRGSVDGKTASYSNLYAPEGDEYVEFMLGTEPPTKQRAGSVFHLALEVPDIEAAVAKLNANPSRKDYKRPLEIKTGLNHKRQCNLYDPDGNRVELMEDHTVDGMPSPMSTVPLFPVP